MTSRERPSPTTWARRSRSTPAPIASSQVTLLPDPGIDALQARFGKVPAPGVHPRVLFGPDQLPALRQLLQTTVQGSFVLSRIEQNNANLRKPGQEVAAVYDHLVQGDLDAMKYASTDLDKKQDDALPGLRRIRCVDSTGYRQGGKAMPLPW